MLEATNAASYRFLCFKKTHNTQYTSDLHRGMLRIIGKDTILKAIHNCYAYRYIYLLLRIIGKDTILKAIHNTLNTLKKEYKVENHRQRYNFESNSQRYECYLF